MLVAYAPDLNRDQLLRMLRRWRYYRIFPNIPELIRISKQTDIKPHSLDFISNLCYYFWRINISRKEREMILKQEAEYVRKEGKTTQDLTQRINELLNRRSQEGWVHYNTAIRVGNLGDIYGLWLFFQQGDEDSGRN